MTIMGLLNNLKFTGELRKYLEDTLNYLVENEISFLEINLRKDIYPYLGSLYDLSDLTVKTKMIRMLNKYNEDNKKAIKRYFKTDSKITVKKLLTLMLIELK